MDEKVTKKTRKKPTVVASSAKPAKKKAASRKKKAVKPAVNPLDVKPSQVIQQIPEVDSKNVKQEEKPSEKEDSAKVNESPSEVKEETKEKEDVNGQEENVSVIEPVPAKEKSETPAEPVKEEVKPVETAEIKPAPQEKKENKSEAVTPAPETKPKKSFKVRLRTFFKNTSRQNVYSLHGSVPFSEALRLSFEQIALLFIVNLAAVFLVFSGIPVTGTTLKAGNNVLLGAGNIDLKSNAIQASLLIAGLSTLLQIYPLWKFGAGLPTMMNSSLLYSGALSLIGRYFYTFAVENPDKVNAPAGPEVYAYGTIMACVLVSGAVLFILGFFAQYWVRLFKPIVTTAVVIGLGLELVANGIQEFLSYNEVLTVVAMKVGSAADAYYDFSIAWPYLIISGSSLLTFLLWYVFYSHRRGRESGALVALAVGYFVSLIINTAVPDLHVLDFSFYHFESAGNFINIQHIFNPSYFHFDIGAIIFTVFVGMAASANSLGNMMASAKVSMGRPSGKRELNGGYVAEGLSSVLSAFTGSLPQSVSSAHVYFMAKTMTVNRQVITFSSVILIILGIFPPVAMFLATIPNAVIGGILLIPFAEVLIMGIKMLGELGFTAKNVLIASLSLALGLGFSSLGATFFNNQTFVFNGVNNTIMFFLATPTVTMFIVSTILAFAIPDKPKLDEQSFYQQHADISLARGNVEDER